MKKQLISLTVKAKYAYYSIKNINKLKLGETVKYDGMKVTCIQGVADPYWDIIVVRSDGEKERINRIHKSELKQSYGLSEMLFRFNSHYNFLMGYWYGIDCRNFKSIFTKISYR